MFPPHITPTHMKHGKKKQNTMKRYRLTENRLRGIVYNAVKRTLNEAAALNYPNDSDYEGSMFYSHDIPANIDVSHERLGRMVRSYQNAVRRLLDSIHDIEYTGIENFKDFYDVLIDNGWNDFANDKI